MLFLALIAGAAIAGWYIAAALFLRQRNIERYVARQVGRYPLMSMPNRIYSDLLTVIALDGLVEDRDFGPESDGEA